MYMGYTHIHCMLIWGIHIYTYTPYIYTHSVYVYIKWGYPQIIQKNGFSHAINHPFRSPGRHRLLCRGRLQSKT